MEPAGSTTRNRQGADGARRLAWQLSRATLVIFIAVIATVTGALLWASWESDEVSVQRQERIARHAFGVALDELALQQETVAVWDEAAARMVADPKDQKWLFDNMGHWLHKIFNHDETWLLDEENRPVQVAVGGRLASLDHYRQRAADVQPLLLAVRGGGYRANDRHDRDPGQSLPAGSTVLTTPRAAHDTHLVLVGGRPAAVSVMLVKPSTPGYVGDRQVWPVMVSLRYLEGAFARDFEAKHLIEGPRFSTTNTPGPGERSVAIDSAMGEHITYFIWTPELPGSRIISAVLPANAAALALLALLMIMLLRRLTQSVRDRGVLEKRATYLACHDPLTGLPNRAYLNACMERMIGSGTARDFAVLLIDLDRFKQVNDTLGHLAGDELIRQFAARLVARLRAEDVVARLGGDEFAILLDGDAAAVAMSRCNTILASFDQPFDLMGTSVHGLASIGAARSNGEPVEGTEMMRRADVALYVAKADGRKCARMFGAPMDLASTRRAQLERELRDAVDLGQFVLWAQPQVDRSGQVVARELLLRWEHPRLGTISPDQVLPVAEETGLIVPIGDWVLGQAVDLLADSADGCLVAINLSPAQLRDMGFVRRAIAMCRARGVAPARLELEITEQTLLDDNRVTRWSLNKLRKSGSRIALDDFGTGYSSLSYLRRFAVDKIKIDRSFVADLDHSSQAQAIVTAIVALGKALHLVVTAEGVETARQQQILLLAGCDELQGHFYAAAEPLKREVRAAAA